MIKVQDGAGCSSQHFSTKEQSQWLPHLQRCQFWVFSEILPGVCVSLVCEHQSSSKLVKQNIPDPLCYKWMLNSGVHSVLKTIILKKRLLCSSVELTLYPDKCWNKSEECGSLQEALGSANTSAGEFICGADTGRSRDQMCTAMEFSPWGCPVEPSPGRIWEHLCGVVPGRSSSVTSQWEEWVRICCSSEKAGLGKRELLSVAGGFWLRRGLVGSWGTAAAALQCPQRACPQCPQLVWQEDSNSHLDYENIFQITPPFHWNLLQSHKM